MMIFFRVEFYGIKLASTHELLNATLNAGVIVTPEAQVFL